jgi:hypothetical protein
MPGAWLARSLARKRKKRTSIVTTGSPQHPGIPCAIGFNGLLYGLPGDRLSCHHLSVMRSIIAN